MIESVKLVGFGALETDLVNSFPAIGKYSAGFLQDNLQRWLQVDCPTQLILYLYLSVIFLYKDQC